MREMRLVVALVLRNLENRPINNEGSSQPTCNMIYPGVGLGFFRIVVEPLIVSHRDNGYVCWKWVAERKEYGIC